MYLIKQLLSFTGSVKLISLALAATICSVFISCKQDNQAPGASKISLSKDSVTVDNDSTKQIITVMADGNWRIDAIDTAWLSFTSMKGLPGTQDFIVTVLPNNTPYTRHAEVTVRIIDTEIITKLHITQSGIPGDRGTLMKIYDLLEGDNWSAKDNWNTNLPLNRWRGILTDNEGNVTSIDIDKFAFGDLPVEICELLALEAICLQWCPDVTGAIPPQIKNLRKLRTFWAAGSSINAIPAEIGELPALQELTFSGAKITRITPEIDNIRTMRKLDLSSNALEGGIPEGFGSKMTGLQQISLSNNPKLGGAIPGTLFNKNMTLFSAFGCSLTGAIPADLGKAVKLETLRLSGNQLSNEIPETVGNLIKLSTLELQNNNLTGNIPESITNIPTANGLVMNLAQNELSGTIAQSIIDHPNFAIWREGICDQRGVGFTNCQGQNVR